MRFLFPIRAVGSGDDICIIEMGFDGEIYDWAYPDILGIAVQCAVRRGFDLRDADLRGADLSGVIFDNGLRK